MEGGQLDCSCGCFGAIGDVGGEEELLRLLGVRGVERWNGWWPRRSPQRQQCGRTVGGAQRGNAGSRKAMRKQKVVRSLGEESRSRRMRAGESER